jgi:hypothetical protein
MTRDSRLVRPSLGRCQSGVRARQPDPGGDRVIVTLDGKFLPYQW